MKEFTIFADELRISVRVVHDELHDTDRHLLVIQRINSQSETEYRLVETFRLMDVISFYLR